jgi:uncharacterized YccA/Bax inhibitor family protein
MDHPEDAMIEFFKRLVSYVLAIPLFIVGVVGLFIMCVVMLAVFYTAIADRVYEEL